jgi:Spy/CpxP family protein refolding chaperone
MKKNSIRVAVLGALAAGAMFAQSNSTQLAPKGEQNPGWKQATPAQRRAHRAQRMANYLNLTAEQRAQAKIVMGTAREQAKPLREQLKSDRVALRSAIKAGNDAQIDRITKAEAPLIAQLSAIRAHAFEKVYATLTPEQKTKADNMRQNFMSHRRAHERQPQTNS